MSLHLKHYLDNQICHKGFKNYLHVYLNLLSLLTGLFDNILLMIFSLVRILYNQCFTSNYFILPTLTIICASSKLLVHLVFPYPYLIIIYNDHLKREREREREREIFVLSCIKLLSSLFLLLICILFLLFTMLFLHCIYLC